MTSREENQCRACRLKIFCYDHISPTVAEEESTHKPTKTSEKEGVEHATPDISESNEDTNSNSSEPISYGKFERSQQNEGEDEDNTNTKTPPPTRDPALPRIQINGIEITY